MDWEAFSTVERSLGARAWSIISEIEHSIGYFIYRKGPPLRPGTNLLNLGSGGINLAPPWINGDIYNFHHYLTHPETLPDWWMDGTRRWRCRDGVFDGIFSEHVLEHLPYRGAYRLLKECLRTLKTGHWLRMAVPNIATYISAYIGHGSQEFRRYPHPVVAIHDVTQQYGHVSVWDAPLLIDAMQQAGFVDVRERKYREGADPQLCAETEERRWEYVCVEGRKP